MSASNQTFTLGNSGTGVLNAWIDFDANGTLDAGVQIATDLALVAGPNVVNFNVGLG